MINSDLSHLTRAQLEEKYQAALAAMHRMAGPAMAWQMHDIKYIQILWSKTKS